MRFSLWPYNQYRFAELRRVCEHAEATGWDGVWVSDHLMPSGPPLDAPVLECWTTAAAVAAVVPRLRIGTLVVGNAFRHPALVAKMAAAVDDISGGRFVLGLGTGWQANEHAALGIELAPPGVRLEQLDEACRVIRSLLHDGETTFEGRHYRLDGAVFSPKPQGELPLLLGVKGDRALALAARHADEWNLWATPERFAERAAVLRAACEEIGRDPAEVRGSAQALFHLGDRAGLPDRERWERTRLPTMIGGVEELRDIVGRYEQAGVSELVVPDFTLSREEREDALGTFLEEVATLFR